MTAIFIYGTLMFPEVMTRLIGGHPHPVPATAFGFRRYEARTRQRGNYSAVVIEPDSLVDGLILEGLPEKKVEILDRFEGLEAGLYVKVDAIVQLAEAREIANHADRPDRTEVTASIYVAGPKLIDLLLEPLQKPWNPEHFRENELDWYLNQLG